MYQSYPTKEDITSRIFKIRDNSLNCRPEDLVQKIHPMLNHLQLTKQISDFSIIYDTRFKIQWDRELKLSEILSTKSDHFFNLKIRIHLNFDEKFIIYL